MKRLSISLSLNTVGIFQRIRAQFGPDAGIMHEKGTCIKWMYSVNIFWSDSISCNNILQWNNDELYIILLYMFFVRHQKHSLLLQAKIYRTNLRAMTNSLNSNHNFRHQVTMV